MNMNILLLFFVIISVFQNANCASEKCLEDYQKFLDSKLLPDTSNNELWAVKMADSYGSWPQDGSSEAIHFTSLGSYYSCLEVGDHVLEDMNFRGRYCHLLGSISLAYDSEEEQDNDLDSKGILKPFLPPFSEFFFGILPATKANAGITSLGICVPSSCTQEEVASTLFNVSVINQGSDFKHTSAPISCKSQEDEFEYDAGVIAYICVLCMFAIIITIGTVLDAKIRLSKQDLSELLIWQQWVLGFSIYTNAARLLDCSPPKKDQIGCLDGMRFLSMSWVLLSHMYSFTQMTLPVANSVELYTTLQEPFLFRAVLNGFPNVDSFLLIGGCLLGYLTFKELDKTNGKLNILMFYLHRYLRITGVYAIVVGFTATLYGLLDFGPLNYTSFEVDYCRESWWRNLLYINNFYGDYPTCMGHSWYLSCEMQMFICTPFMLVPMWNLWKKKGSKSALSYAILILILATGEILCLSIVEEWPINLLVYDPEYQDDYVYEGYVTPWARCQPYIIGIGLGFVLHITKGQNIKINKFLQIILWAFAFGMGLSVIYCIDVAEYLITGTYPSFLACVLFNTFHKVAWGLALAWLIFACFHGYGGFINTLLSWEAFRPLGRLSFIVYLVHYNFIPVIYGQFTYNIVVSHLFVVFMILFTMVFVHAIALLLSVTVEMPLATTEKLLFGSLLKKK